MSGKQFLRVPTITVLAAAAVLAGPAITSAASANAQPRGAAPLTATAAPYPAAMWRLAIPTPPGP
jgi:hypothetical protein